MGDRSAPTRRDFLRTTGQAATLAAATAYAPAVLSAPSPGKTIGVGCIGLGTRGGDLINSVVAVPDVRVVAVCDVYGRHRQKGIERSRKPDVKAYVDYRDLLADRNVDAVISPITSTTGSTASGAEGSRNARRTRRSSKPRRS